MAAPKKETELMRQIKEAINTLAYDNDFLGYEERQMEVLTMLQNHIRQSSNRLDRRLAEDGAKLQKMKKEILKH